jgi:hypothetical protein
MSTPRLSELEGRLLQAPEPGTFSSAELDGLAEPVRRHLTQAIAPGTPLATAGHLCAAAHARPHQDRALAAVPGPCRLPNRPAPQHSQLAMPNQTQA